ncbi:metal-dependent hydrolase [Candidatus Woesearchaeota archaeon]|nr:metal-dependent hydrolase [Candidatus Woesearchaeota archaeon]
MLFKTHLLLGALFFLLTKDHFTGGSVLLFFSLVLLGSILPDIDEPNSKVNRGGGIVGIMVAMFTRHRGIFHSLVMAAFVFLAVTYWWSNYYAWALLIGYVAHLVGDAITPMGVAFLYPFSRYRIRGFVRTGGMAEVLVFAILVVMVIKMVL